MKKTYFLQTILILSMAFAGKTAQAQDPHFSQYFNASAWVNPATTGKQVDDWRVSAVYRSQWWGGGITPFTTTAVAIEKSLHAKGASKSHWGLGLSMLSDASNSGLLKNNYISGSAAYNIDLGGSGEQLLGIGMSAAYASRIFDASKFAFQSQYGSMGFQRTIPSGDPATSLSAHYFDINAGVDYRKHMSNWGFGLGAAVFHAGSPEESVYNNNTYNLPRRYTLYGSIFLRLMKSGDEMHFSTITDIQAGHSVVTLGGLYKANLRSASVASLNLGLYQRFGDALYPYIALEAKRWVIGLSYDIVNSDVSNTYNNVQSTELSFTLNLGKIR